MVDPEARRGERLIYKKPYLAYIDQMPLSPRFKKVENEVQNPIEERHFIQMAQTSLRISLRKRFKGVVFRDLTELAYKVTKYEELLKEEQHKRNASKGTYYTTPSSSVHLVEIESKEKLELEETMVVMAELAKVKGPVSYKALLKPPKDQKPPPFTRESHRYTTWTQVTEGKRGEGKTIFQVGCCPGSISLGKIKHSRESSYD
ncbi:unnamed protein product [Prunus armeniaca]